MNILVTGSEGFIGSNLVEKLLYEGFKVTALVQYNSFNSAGWLANLSHKNLKITFGDIRDENLILKCCKNKNLIINLAALISIPYSYQAINSNIETNILGASNICKGALKNKVKKVTHVSSSEVYGSAIYKPINEKHPLQPQSPYSATKIGADAIALSYYYSFGLGVTIARPFNTFGPRQSLRAIIPTVMHQIINGKKKIKLGVLNTKRDFNYVSNTIDGIISLIGAKKTSGEVFNIGYGKNVSMLDLVKNIKNVTGENFDVIYDKQKIRPKNSEVQELLCDLKKIKKYTNYSPKISLEDGLKFSFDWFKKNNHLYNNLIEKKYF